MDRIAGLIGRLEFSVVSRGVHNHGKDGVALDRERSPAPLRASATYLTWYPPPCGPGEAGLSQTEVDDEPIEAGIAGSLQAGRWNPTIGVVHRNGVAAG